MGLTPENKAWLMDRFGADVRFDEPMARHTSFRAGGPADAFVAPRRREDLVRLTAWLREAGLPWLVMGRGTNLLAGDAGLRMAVVVLDNCLTGVAVTDAADGAVFVRAGAGARLSALCGYCLRRGYAGMNSALGIPGSVGGAVMMNAGTSLGAVGDALTSVTMLFDDGEVRNVGRESIRFEYRRMRLKKECQANGGTPPVILDATFRLRASTPEHVKREAERIIRVRRRTQPVRFPSAGCFFRNPPGGKSAGWLIEKAGMKGRAVGGAQVSERHANFIVNRGRASAADIIALAEAVRERVFDAFGVRLEPEVAIIGHETDQKKSV